MQWVTTDLHAKIPRYIYQANKVIRKTISKSDFREKTKQKRVISLAPKQSKFESNECCPIRKQSPHLPARMSESFGSGRKVEILRRGQKLRAFRYLFFLKKTNKHVFVVHDGRAILHETHMERSPPLYIGHDKMFDTTVVKRSRMNFVLS